MSFKDVIKSVASPIVSGVFGLGSSILGGRTASDNTRYQKEFAQNSISWRVADARRAGINPLYALGAPAVSYQSQPIGDYGLGKFGQDLGRAAGNYFNPKDKTLQNLQKQNLQAEIQTRTLNNRILERQLNSAGKPVSLPGPHGGVNVSDQAVVTVPDQRVASKQTGVSAGDKPLHGDFIRKDGSLRRLPSRDASESLETAPVQMIEESIERVKELLKGKAARWSPWLRKRMEKEIRKLRPRHPDPSKMFVWDLYRALWVPVKKRKGNPIWYRSYRW